MPGGAAKGRHRLAREDEPDHLGLFLAVDEVDYRRNIRDVGLPAQSELHR